MLASWGRHYKAQQSEQLEPQKSVVTQFWRLDVPDQNGCRVGFPSGLRGNLSRAPLLVSGGLGVPWLVDGVFPVSSHHLSPVIGLSLGPKFPFL